MTLTEATLLWLGNLARVGVRSQTITVEVDPESWLQWTSEAQRQRGFAVSVATEPEWSIQFHGPARIDVVVKPKGGNRE